MRLIICKSICIFKLNNKILVKTPTFCNFALKLEKKMKKNIFTLILFFSIVNLSAQDVENKSNRNIFESLRSNDSTSRGSVKIYQDTRIEQLINEHKSVSEPKSTVTANGFRVQVFSSNVQRTAKAEAFKVEKALREEFPDYEVYVNYTSPFWKVRVGDFKTFNDAQELRRELIGAFPNLRSETYTVKDIINL